MTTSTFTVAGTNASAAQFRAWGLALSNALTAVGVPKTADTGQIDWATVAAPGAINTQMGYEIRRFNDTVQGTAPIVFRIDFGSGTSSVNNPSLWFTVGKGSNGAGTITSVLLAATQAPITATASLPCYVSSGDGSLLALALWPNHSAPLTAIVDRSRTPARAPTGTGLTYAQKSGSTSFVQRTYNYPTGVLPASNPGNLWPASVPCTSGSGLAVGGLAPVFPAVVTDGTMLWQPSAVVSYAPLDAGIGAPIIVPGWGTYLPTGQSAWDAGGGNSLAAIAWS